MRLFLSWISGLFDVVNLRKLELCIEFVLLFVAVPLGCWLAHLPVIAVLIVFALATYFKLRHDHVFDRGSLTRFRISRAEWKQIFLRYLIALPLLIGLVCVLGPQKLFQMPRQQTILWLLIMVMYPLISVWPQEVIYRAFFLRRYEPLFGNGTAAMVASAIAFGFAHIVFGNPVAMFLTAIGGFLFARTFQRTRALGAVIVEHAVYGCTIFTVGLGQYFLQGTTAFAQAVSGM